MFAGGSASCLASVWIFVTKLCRRHHRHLSNVIAMNMLRTSYLTRSFLSLMSFFVPASVLLGNPDADVDDRAAFFDQANPDQSLL